MRAIRERAKAAPVAIRRGDRRRPQCAAVISAFKGEHSGFTAFMVPQILDAQILDDAFFDILTDHLLLTRSRNNGLTRAVLVPN